MTTQHKINSETAGRKPYSAVAIGIANTPPPIDVPAIKSIEPNNLLLWSIIHRPVDEWDLFVVERVYGI